MKSGDMVLIVGVAVIGYILWQRVARPVAPAPTTPPPVTDPFVTIIHDILTQRSGDGTFGGWS